MKLKEYLFRKNLSVTEFAKSIDYSRTHISRILNGDGKPSKKLARAIEKTTNSEVSARELLEDSDLQINQNKLTDEIKKKITRIGIYGVVTDEGKILVVRQQRGPYAGKLDFPGGGIEFGESAEQAMRREFAEEVAMEFDSLQLVDNLTATVDVQSTPSNESYLFYQIGMIYRVHGCRLIKGEKLGDLQHTWIDLMALSEGQCSKLLWKWRMLH